jgi:alcohol dehydrogenase/propanol-preferring alcohol dehydrogenase
VIDSDRSGVRSRKSEIAWECPGSRQAAAAVDIVSQKAKFCAEPKTWITNGGGYAEYMIAEAEGCTFLPDGLGWESAAPLFCGGFSAMSAYRAARPQPGERIAVIGIGGLGHLALQVAKAMGHEVVAITNSPDKQADAIAMGADDVLVVKDHVGQELAKMGGVDAVLSFSPSMKQNSQADGGTTPGRPSGHNGCQW